MLSNVKMTVVHLAAEGIERVAPYGYREVRGTEWAHDVWCITLEYQGRTHRVPSYKTGIGHRKPIRESRGFWQGASSTKAKITAQSVLESLFTDASCGLETFADFAENSGLSTDSRKALDMYLACQQAGADLRKLFGADYSAIEREVNDNA